MNPSDGELLGAPDPCCLPCTGQISALGPSAGARLDLVVQVADLSFPCHAVSTLQSSVKAGLWVEH